MANKGSGKFRSVQQEDYVAALYNGVRSPSSGGADNDQGDVRTMTQLIECKCKGSAEGDQRRIEQGLQVVRSKLLKDMEKVAFEAWQEERESVVTLREWAPESKLAGASGWVDFTVRLQHEDAHRNRVYEEARAAEALL